MNSYVYAPCLLLRLLASKSAVAILFICFSAWLQAAGESDQVRIKVANLEQDVGYLRSQVGQMKLEIESLVRQNNSLKKQLDAQSKRQGNYAQNYITLEQLRSSLAALKVELAEARKADRHELVIEISRQMEKLAEQTEKALRAMARSIESQPQAVASINFTNDYPKEGVVYTVRSGDTLSQIAKLHDSSVVDIQNANKIPDINNLQVGQILFIPQRKQD